MHIQKLLQTLIISVIALNSTYLISNFLLQKPAIISPAEINKLPCFWEARFGGKDGGCNFAYHDGRVAVKLDGKKFTTDTALLWQELSEHIDTLIPSDGAYHIDDIRKITHDATHQPQSMSVQEVAQFIKNNNVVFYTGAGISLAADVDDMSRLMNSLGMNKQMPTDEYAGYVMRHEQKVLTNFAYFCKQAFTAAPTKAHHALTHIALHKKTQIMTENFDFLHQRTGIMPYCINAYSLRANILPKDLQAIDAIICIGLSHDDRGFLGWYKRHHPQGIIIAFDIATPQYLGNEDYLVAGDAQETIVTLQEKLIR